MPPEARPKPSVTLKSSDLSEMSKNERIKAASRGLYFVSDGKGGNEAFADEIAALGRGDRETLSGVAKELSKFSGVYQQKGRGERGAKTGDNFLMVRIKNPAGGELSARQWAALDQGTEDFADGTLRITSRQTIQYHHVYGDKLASLIRHLNRSYRDQGTLAACGDVNRNVTCSPIDGLDPLHEPRGLELANEIAAELAPRTSSYFQIWVSDEEGTKQGPVSPEEPIYGDQYLPRKFKIGIAHPTDNSVDVLTNDVGLVPVVTNGRANGELWDLYTGGGMGMTHNNPATAPLLALYLGRIRRDQVVPACRSIAIIQNENGERKDRRQARWKYTLRRLGLEAVTDELKRRFQLEIETATPQPLPPMNLHLGWHEQRAGGSYFGISVPSGRVKPCLRGGIRAAAERLDLGVRLTPQQDLILCNIGDRDALQAILDEHGVKGAEVFSQVRRNAMACPAKPTCGLAMTDAEGILPSYIDALDEAGLGDIDAVIRMTGCPNGCARPPTAEVGIYGYGKNDYVILVGGSREGSRLAHTLYSRLPGEQMIPVLVGLFTAIRDHNSRGSPVGDFLHDTDPGQLRGWIGIDEGE